MTRGWSVTMLLVLVTGLVALVVVAVDADDPDGRAADADDAGGSTDPDRAIGRGGEATSLVESGVLVTASGCRLESFGVGVVLAEGIATNAHVVAGATSVSVVPSSGDDPVSAQVVAWDPLHDVALLRPETEVGRPLDVGQAVAGSEVTALARGLDAGDAAVLMAVEVHVERLIDIRISDIYGDGRYERDGLELSGELGPGDSGAGLVDDGGAVVGLVFSSSRGQDGVAYAVSSSEITRLTADASEVAVDTGDCRR